MTTTALPEPVSGSPVRAALARAARYARTERGIVTLALGAIGLHIADDNYFQPEPGTSPLEHLASGLVPIGAPRRRRRPLPARPRRGARLARLDLRRPRDHVRRPERVLALPGRGVGRPLHNRPARDPRRHRPDDRRRRGPLAVAALLRIPNADLPPPGADARRVGGTGIRDLLAGRLPGRLRLHVHAHGTRRRPARPPRPVRARHRHDERFGRADGLVRPLQEPRRGDPLPRRDPLRRGPDADPARLRRPAPEPARSGHERRRHGPLGGRPRPGRRRRVPPDAPRRGRRPDRRVRLLRRRRDPDRGGRAVDRLQGDRVGRRRVPHRRGRR